MKIEDMDELRQYEQPVRNVQRTYYVCLVQYEYSGDWWHLVTAKNRAEIDDMLGTSATMNMKRARIYPVNLPIGDYEEEK